MQAPTGTVTFLFTDIEGSSRLWERFPVDMGPALARHDALLRQNGCYAGLWRVQAGLRADEALQL